MNWLQQLVSRRREYHNLSDEIAEHLQEKVEELMSGGMPRQEAEAAARRQFGNALLLEEHSREVWQWAMFDAVLARPEICVSPASPQSGLHLHGLADARRGHWRKHSCLQHGECPAAPSPSLF